MTIGDGFSSIMSIILIPACIIATVLIFYVIWKYRRLGKLESNAFIQRYGTLIENTNPGGGIVGSYWNGFILNRWIATVFIMIVVRN